MFHSVKNTRDLAPAYAPQASSVPSFVALGESAGSNL
jgi:hypothetical protein